MKRFNQAQIKTLVDICVSIGTVIFGAVAIPIALSAGSLTLLLIGLATSIWFWYIGLSVSKHIL